MTALRPHTVCVMNIPTVPICRRRKRGPRGSDLSQSGGKTGRCGGQRGKEPIQEGVAEAMDSGKKMGCDMNLKREVAGVLDQISPGSCLGFKAN